MCKLKCFSPTCCALKFNRKLKMVLKLRKLLKCSEIITENLKPFLIKTIIKTKLVNFSRFQINVQNRVIKNHSNYVV